MCVCVFYGWNLYLHMASINLILMMDSINIYFSAFLIYDLDLCYFCRFQVKKKRFFENFMTIILFGAVGTLISCGIISLGTSSNIIFLFFNNINFFLLVVQRQEKVYVKFLNCILFLFDSTLMWWQWFYLQINCLICIIMSFYVTIFGLLTFDNNLVNNLFHVYAYW